jgi:hypothetical protein
MAMKVIGAGEGRSKIKISRYPSAIGDRGKGKRGGLIADPFYFLGPWN